MHSYSFVPAEKNVIHAITKYGDWEIASTIVKGNIFGVQFHPEKSQADGLRFFRNFMNIIS